METDIKIYQNGDRTGSVVVKEDGTLTLVTGGIPQEQDITNVPNISEWLFEHGFNPFAVETGPIPRHSSPSKVRG